MASLLFFNSCDNVGDGGRDLDFDKSFRSALQDTGSNIISRLQNVRSGKCLTYRVLDFPPSVSEYFQPTLFVDSGRCDSSDSMWVHDEALGTIKAADNLSVCLEAIGTVKKFSDLGIRDCDSSNDNQRFFYQWRDVDNGNVRISLLNHNFLVEASQDAHLSVNIRYSGSYAGRLWGNRV